MQTSIENNYNKNPWTHNTTLSNLNIVLQMGMCFKEINFIDAVEDASATLLCSFPFSFSANGTTLMKSCT